MDNRVKALGSNFNSGSGLLHTGPLTCSVTHHRALVKSLPYTSRQYPIPTAFSAVPYLVQHVHAEGRSDEQALSLPEGAVGSD